MMFETFDKDNLPALCNQVASHDHHLAEILSAYGYPPFWTREPGFETLIHIILEQQVSLASAKAALDKLRHRLGSVSPEALIKLGDEEMKACYFSRQKTGYARHLASSLITGELKGGPALQGLELLDDEVVRKSLKMIKGIGDWSVDVYLMMVLHRCDLFPVNDIALANSVRHQLKNPQLTTTEILRISQHWRPYRTIAAFLFWHAYICRKGIRFG